MPPVDELIESDIDKPVVSDELAESDIEADTLPPPAMLAEPEIVEADMLLASEPDGADMLLASEPDAADALSPPVPVESTPQFQSA